jgi:tetrapyrrole methylase family protein/MazG family protein
MTDISKRPIDKLLEIMSRLRGDGGCPWDRKQDHESLKPYVVEEAYEVVEAIESGDDDELKEELGDLLLQIVFHCQIAAETKRFNFDDVAEGISDKLWRRHPHVFGDQRAETEEEALQHWERIKAGTEGKKRKKRHAGTPILHRALRLQEEVVSYGFDWEETGQLVEKLEEELGEVRDALGSGNRDDITEEIGDLLFMTVNLARYVDVHPEDALDRSINKFSKRFKEMEDMITGDNKSLDDMKLDEMETYWQAAKRKERKHKGVAET